MPLDVKLKKTIRKIINTFGYDIISLYKNEIFDIANLKIVEKIITYNIKNVHYGCGDTFFNQWLNIDQYDYSLAKMRLQNNPETHYLPVDLTKNHPFPDNYFNFGFSEDFIEHLNQADSITFLSECYRTFSPGGVLRLSFPGLAGVLKKHYTDFHYPTVKKAQFDAYTKWGHQHFYSEDDIRLVAQHIGFTNVAFVEYGKSEHEMLSNRDTRTSQKDINIFVELKK